jgi:predicted small integral membrane protein
MWRRWNGIIVVMNGMRLADTLRRTIQNTIIEVREARFFRDRLSVGLLVAALIINGLNLLWLGLHVRPTEGQVPVRFSSLTLFDALGPWYFPFLIALFGLGVTVVNDIFAYHSFGRSRLASFFLLIAAVVVAIFSFVISSAFGVVR